MFALVDFLDHIGKEMARHQMEYEAQQLEKPQRPSWLSRQFRKLTPPTSSSYPDFCERPAELITDSIQCEP